MRVLVTGIYDPSYNRTQIALKGLRQTNCELIELPLTRLSRQSLAQVRAINCDVIYLPSFSHKSVLPVSKSNPAPLVFDPLISRYMTKVFDYKKFGPLHPMAWRTFWSDRQSMRRADVLIADTAAHGSYYVETFGVAKERISVVPVGVDCDEFHPPAENAKSERNSRAPLVGFYGSFNPLQGIDVIVRAAKLLPQVNFEIIGSGNVGDKVAALVHELNVKNINFCGWVDYSLLPEHIGRYDLCLGIFGDTIKTPLVVPNKIFHYASCARPIITVDSPAVREIFTSGKDLVLVERGASPLANEITRLLASPEERRSLSANARALMVDHYGCKQIGELLLGAFELGVRTRRAQQP